MGWIDNENKNEDVALSLYQDIIENLDDLKENNAPLVKDFIEEIIKEQNNKSTLIPETTRIQTRLSYNRQHNVLDFANKQLEEQNNEVSENDRNIITIKRMHAAAAGVVGEELFDDLIEEDVEFYEDEVPKGADFCILVNGDSMEPMIKEGTYAFIKRETNIKDGTIALVVLDGTSFIKRVDIHPEYLKLISLNPKYEDITVSSFNDLKVVGKIVL
ncbi:S24 family peptidase [Staphylococcus simulans]|uniref:S24 family peptidase n=1 Tax=Staphylococcus simulans TaxID=1286 RepID=UPI0030C274E9